MADAGITARIARARDSLVAKLAELRRREARVIAALSPIRHLGNPWLHVGAAAVVGYRFARGRHGRRASAGEAAPAGRETVARSIVRASLVTAAQVIVRRALLPDA